MAPLRSSPIFSPTPLQRSSRRDQAPEVAWGHMFWCQFKDSARGSASLQSLTLSLLLLRVHMVSRRNWQMTCQNTQGVGSILLAVDLVWCQVRAEVQAFPRSATPHVPRSRVGCPLPCASTCRLVEKSRTSAGRVRTRLCAASMPDNSDVPINPVLMQRAVSVRAQGDSQGCRAVPESTALLQRWLSALGMRGKRAWWARTISSSLSEHSSSATITPPHTAL